MSQKVTLNNGKSKNFITSYKYPLGDAIIDYVVEKAKELGCTKKKMFTSKELKEAPWMVTQSEVLTKTWLCSLDEVVEVTRRRLPGDKSGLTEQGKKLVASMRAAKAYAQR